MRVTPRGQCLALDVFEREVGPAVGCEPRVEQPRDVGVVERGEDLAFPREALRGGLREMLVHELQRHPAPEQSVGALGEPHRPHAAAAERAQHAPRPDRLADERRRCRAVALQMPLDDLAGFEEPVGVSGSRGHEAAQQFGCARLALRERVDPALALVHRPVERLVHQRRQARELGGGQVAQRHRHTPSSSVRRMARAFCQSRSTLRSGRPSACATSGTDSPAK